MFCIILINRVTSLGSKMGIDQTKKKTVFLSACASIIHAK